MSLWHKRAVVLCQLQHVSLGFGLISEWTTLPVCSPHCGCTVCSWCTDISQTSDNWRSSGNRSFVWLGHCRLHDCSSKPCCCTLASPGRAPHRGVILSRWWRWLDCDSSTGPPRTPWSPRALGWPGGRHHRCSLQAPLWSCSSSHIPVLKIKGRSWEGNWGYFCWTLSNSLRLSLCTTYTLFMPPLHPQTFKTISFSCYIDILPR